ncbi:hypothetical protein C8R46DRAFT_1024888 [Mycena filopes]|nr:hypothetical protein C8R46DRAFT_1024888 [Mycena filopes]
MATLSIDTAESCVSHMLRLSCTELFLFSCTSLANHQRVMAHLQRLPNHNLGSMPLGKRTGAFKGYRLGPRAVFIALLRAEPSHLREWKLSAPITSPWSIFDSCRVAPRLSSPAKSSNECSTPAMIVDGPPLQAPDSKPAIPPLDVYCAEHEGAQTAAFLCLATGRVRVAYAGEVNAGVIRAAHTLTREDAPPIHVFEVRSANPLDAVLRLPTTADICAWLLDCFWHGYPKATFEGTALTTPARMPITSSETRQRAYDIIQNNLQIGYWVDCQYSQPHKCLSVASCPSTYRRTVDRGCLMLKFADVPHAARSQHRSRSFEDIEWTLGSVSSCRKIWFAYQRPQPRSFRSHEFYQMNAGKITSSC